MAEPFLSELRLMSFAFPPQGWALCNGQLLAISENQALFALLGTTYGGDGRVNFGLPDLRGRTGIHEGSGHTLGERAGQQTHTVSINELPTHTHAMFATAAEATTSRPKDNLLASAPNSYAPGAGDTGLATGNTGGSQAHENMQPYLTLSWCIALQGNFPSST